jgi:hypothetical protein
MVDVTIRAPVPSPMYFYEKWTEFRQPTQVEINLVMETPGPVQYDEHHAYEHNEIPALPTALVAKAVVEQKRLPHYPL